MDNQSKNRLNYNRFVSMPEWQAILVKLDEIENDYLEFALNTPTFEEKEYYRGAIEAIRIIREMPEEVLKIDIEEENLDAKSFRAQA